jgi:hypothetical protein
MADFLASNPDDIVTFDIAGKDVFENVTGTARPLG